MKNILLILILSIIATGCSTTIGNSKLGTSESKIETQMSGIKNKSDARELFGTPNLIFDKNGMETYEYKTIDAAGRYSWMIPVWGWLAPIWQDTYTYDETNLFISFDKSDNVSNWDVLETGGTTN
jgi:uncharacterized protein YceK